MLATREQLLDAAERAIRAGGPQVSMEAIAAAANVTKPILYRMVGDRDALIAALAERFVVRINRASGKAIAEASGPQETMRALVSAYLVVVDDSPSLFLFVTSGPSNDHIGQALRLADRSAAPLAEQLVGVRGPVGLDPAVARTWAYGLIGALQYVTLWWLRDRPFSREQLGEHLVELLWAGLRGDRGATQ